MTKFTLDTSGSINFATNKLQPPLPDGWPVVPRDNLYWSDLDPFTQGYIEALFASGISVWNADRDPGYWHSGMVPADLNRFDRFAPETLARIIADCTACCKANADVLGVLNQQALNGAGRYHRSRAKLTLYLGEDDRMYLKETNK